jgi:H+/Cl- antiporter ClcA
VFLIEVLKRVEGLSKRLTWWAPLKGIAGGAVLVCLTFIFSKQYLGLGLDTIQNCLTGEKTAWYAFILKSVYTSITLGFGGSGGIVTPIFFIGSSAGTLFASILRLDTATFAAIGMVSVLAGAANTPIAASIMAMELFGPAVASYATVACVVSFLITGHRSVYPSQILEMKKSESIDVETGKEIEKVFAKASPREKSFTKTLLKAIKVFRKIK